MTNARIKRSQIQTFMDTTPSTTATYSLLGQGITTGKIEYNPKTVEEIYIDVDSATSYVESYAPKLPVEAHAIHGDAVFEFIDSLRKSRAVLADAETNIINVWMYETATTGAYPAEKQTVSIQIENFGGDGGTAVKINYTMNFIGTAVTGTFNPTTKTFTAS